MGAIMVRALLVLLLLTGCPSNWRARDTVLEVGLVGITAVDWQQTREITKSCRETNPVIGQCGDRVNMHVYFVSVLVLEMIAGRLLSPDYRTLLHGLWIGVESSTVWSNHNN